MSKYLIKPIASIYLNPIAGIKDLKRDLLLYDNLGMLNLDSLLDGLNQYKRYPFYQDALNEVEFLIKNDKFVDLKSLIIPGNVLMDEEDTKLANFTMKLKTQMNEIKNINKEKQDTIFWKLDELDTRLWCNIANATNESIFVVPSLKDSSSFLLPQTTKEKAYSIIHNSIPLPTDDTPWEKIFDFNNDAESRQKLLSLKNWINELPASIKHEELEDKIKYLVNEYSDSLRRHKIASQLLSFKTVVKVLPSAVTNIVRFKFDKAIDAFFAIVEQQVNFQKHKERTELPGHELAYISFVNKSFNRK